MGTARSDAEERVAALLRTARKSLGLSLAFLSHMDGKVQTLEVADAARWLPVNDGYTQAQATSLCQLILNGELPPVLPDLRNFPSAMQTPAAKRSHIRSFVAVPVQLSDGTIYGTFCAGGVAAHPALTERDEGLMQVLAQAAALIIEPDVRAAERDRALNERYAPMMADGARRSCGNPLWNCPPANFARRIVKPISTGVGHAAGCVLRGGTRNRSRGRTGIAGRHDGDRAVR